MLTRLLNRNRVLISTLLLMLGAQAVQAQTTTFTYQGKLTDGGNPATGIYDFQVKLFDTAALGTGTQQGTTLTVSNITVTGGIFTVPVDFGACLSCFNGASRFLEIAVKLTSGGTFTTLSPRQPLTSTPYAIRSLNATVADGLSVTCVNCITSSQIQSVNGSAVSGTIPVASLPAGSANYIQNTTSPQASANFNISGDGTAGGTLSANLLNATTQFNLSGNRILSNAGTNNLFVGVQAGAANTGSANAFFGNGAGNSNTSGSFNSFFGASAGLNNTGGNNSFFGAGAGVFNTTGADNAFFGAQAGQNSTGSANSIFGVAAGFNNTGNDNSFFGRSAGFTNTSGSSNSFFGVQAGRDNSIGFNNSFFGRAAGKLNVGGVHNAFFGSEAGMTNTEGIFNSFFGSWAGRANTFGGSNSFFGYQAGLSNTEGSSNAFFGTGAGRINDSSSNNSFFGSAAGGSNTGYENTFLGANAGGNNTTGIRNTFAGFKSGGCDDVSQCPQRLTGSGNSFFGYQAGFKNTTGIYNNFFGYWAGYDNLTGNYNNFFGTVAGNSNTTGSSNTIIGDNADVGSGNLDHATAIGAGAIVTASNRVQIGRTPDQFGQNGDTVAIGAFAMPSTSTTVCINNLGVFTACASSRRYKDHVQSFTPGLNLIQGLRPVTFNWKEGHAPDLGLIAEEVAEVEPLLTIYNTKGEIEGVKYAQLNVVLINAVKEQQVEIEKHNDAIKEQQAQVEQYRKQLAAQQTQITEQGVKLAQQQREIDALKQLLCRSHPRAEVCQARRRK